MLNLWTCTEAKAIETVESMMSELPGPVESPEEASAGEESGNHNSDNSSSFFRFLNRAPAVTSEIRPQNDTAELTRYLSLPREDENSDPLSFWRYNAQLYPKLAKLAQKYLGFPGSSGSAERLFSVGGALQRSRRARLNWKTVERLLCHRDVRIQQLFRKFMY